MNILITGSNGFIGSKVTADLMSMGHNLISCGRNKSCNQIISQQLKFIYADFCEEITQTEWLAKLSGIDEIHCIVNCVGITHAKQEIVWNIHYLSPKNLITASMKKGLQKVIQISALGIDKIDIPFAKSKKALDDFLMMLPINVFVLRPSLVYGAGSYGGTSLFRGLAGLPLYIPVPGKGDETFQPIHIDDLSRSVTIILSQLNGKKILSAVGPKQLTMWQILISLRSWLGLGSARKLSVPTFLVKWVAKIGDYFPTTINSTLYQMLLKNNIASLSETAEFQQTMGFVPKELTETLASSPSHVQDRWHAQLYFLKPLLRISLGGLWLFSGLTSLFFYPIDKSLVLLQQIGIVEPSLVLYGSSLLDILLGLLTLANYRLQRVGFIQIVVIIVYSLIITLWLPGLWLDPFGPVAKNIPILVATAMMMAMESKR